MKKKKLFFYLAGLLLLVIGQVYASRLPNIAFYYGFTAPPHEFKAFDILVVEPNPALKLKPYLSSSCKHFAYLSVGEATKDAPNIKPAWVLGRDKVWRTRVMDLSLPAWRNYLLTRISQLKQQGYKGLFLDTLDSYRLVVNSNYVQQESGLVTLITAIHRQFPTMKLILNRGFAVIPKVHQFIYAVAAESLFKSWNEASKKYMNVVPKDTEWLTNKLTSIKSDYKLPIVVIDYLPIVKRKQAKADAARIAKLGFIPYVTNSDLTAVGIGRLEVIPRKILLLYVGPKVARIENPLLLSFAMPLEYMGYKPISREWPNINSLPNFTKDRYSGVVLEAGVINLKRDAKLQQFIRNIVLNKIPLITVGNVYSLLSSPLQQMLKLRISDKVIPKNATFSIKTTNREVGYEAKPQLNVNDLVEIHNLSGKSLLTVHFDKNRHSNLIARTYWGGYISYPFLYYYLPNGDRTWIVNPFAYLRKSLRLPVIPAPDVTTENGRRLMLVHVDGDGFHSKVEKYNGDYAAKEMLEKIFEHYRIPTTVSVIQRDVEANGVPTIQSNQLEELARSIFKLPWVEIASHSYSHPFIWQENLRDADFKVKEFYRSVQGYVFELDKEITGSIKYINSKLAPPNKKCMVFLWTGDCNPGTKALELTNKTGVLAMNGGGAFITKQHNYLSYIWPLGVYKDKYFQVFAPMTNENYYTDLWGGPYYGYRRVIETFKLTDKPRRLKPIDIYYHFYSATKIASLRALKQVYDWALKQKVFNIFASEYINKVLDFNNIVIAKRGDGWLIKSGGELREFRVHGRARVPNLKESSNVVGYNFFNDSSYIHIGAKHTTFLGFAKDNSLPYLVSANGRISQVRRKENRLSFILKGHLPLEFTLGNINSCVVQADDKIITGVYNSNEKEKVFALPSNTTVKIAIQCGS